MSVLINGMDMPERCGQCFLRVGNCKQRMYMEQRPKGCPLVEIPTPHGRLVDVDDFMGRLISNAADLRTLSTGTVGKALHDTPTIVEAEGSEE